MKSNSICAHVFGLAVLCLCASTTQAVVIPPQNISPTTISVLSGAFTPTPPSSLNAAINQSGLDVIDFTTADLASVTHNPANVNEARLFTSSSFSLRLDLGATYTITTAYLWNNDSAYNNNIGTYSYTFRNSSLNSLGTSGTLSATDIEYLEQRAPDVFTLGSGLASVRYVDLTATRRDGSEQNICGLGEVAFTTVPEPSASFLVLLGLGSLVARRKR